MYSKVAAVPHLSEKVTEALGRMQAALKTVTAYQAKVFEHSDQLIWQD